MLDTSQALGGPSYPWKPSPDVTMATSAWKICLMNLFLEEWTSWMMSPWRVSRFFSRKPGQRQRAVTPHQLWQTRLSPSPHPPQ